MTTEWEAKRIIRDASMRRALLYILEEATRDLRPGGSDKPEPMRSDEDIKDELRRIILGREEKGKGWLW